MAEKQGLGHHQTGHELQRVLHIPALVSASAELGSQSVPWLDRAITHVGASCVDQAPGVGESCKRCSEASKGSCAATTPALQG